MAGSRGSIEGQSETEEGEQRRSGGSGCDWTISRLIYSWPLFSETVPIEGSNPRFKGQLGVIASYEAK
jgi:hypothetical protein